VPAVTSRRSGSRSGSTLMKRNHASQTRRGLGSLTLFRHTGGTGYAEVTPLGNRYISRGLRASRLPAPARAGRTDRGS
jgi:hypothetical protein